jgi:hypothetical protein
VAGENGTSGIGGFHRFFDDIRPPLRFKFEYLRRLAQNSDRYSSRFRSLTEGIVVRLLRPLNIHRTIMLTHQETDFLAWTWDSMEKGEKVRWVDQIPLKKEYKSVFQWADGIRAISHEFTPTLPDC